MKVEYWRNKAGLLVEEFTDNQGDTSQSYSPEGFNTSYTFFKDAKRSILTYFFKHSSRLQFEVH